MDYGGIILDITEKRYVAPKEFLLYGVANGGQVLSYGLITSYIVYFYTNVFNIDNRIVSAMMFIQGMWDAINDPLMGSIIDRTRTRYGKLRPYLLAVPIPLAISTISIFAGPLLVGDLSSTDPKKVIYMIITYFIWEFFYTVGDVPFWGLSAAISPNPEERTKAITYARFISRFIGFIPGVVLPVAIDLVHSGTINTSLRNVFFVLGIITGIAGMGLFSLAGLFVKERAIQSSEEPSFKDCFKGFYNNPPLRLLILKDILGSPGGVGGIFSTYYFVDVLGTLSITLLTGIPGVITDTLSYASLGFTRRKLNNKQILIAMKAIENIVQISKYLLSQGGRFKKLSFMVPLLAVESGINGLLGAARMVVPTDMVGETVDYAEWKTGQRTEGVSFSVVTFIGKFNGAISRGLGTFLTSVIGYKTSNVSTKIPQSERTQHLIFAMYTIIPAFLGILGYIPMFKYDLVGSKRERMYRELAEIRKKRVEEAQAIEQEKIEDSHEQKEE